MTDKPSKAQSLDDYVVFCNVPIEPMPASMLTDALSGLEVSSSLPDDTYRVEPSANHTGVCPCGHDTRWTITWQESWQEERTEASQAWGGLAGKALAEDICVLMNMAFEHGAETADDQRQVETTTPRSRSYQDRVYDWAVECFGLKDATDPEMRSHRFLEEALELGQACGCTQEAALRILEYVYSRPVGVIDQEVGGVQVSLGILCTAFYVNLEHCAELELLRIARNIDTIRARHQGKPNFSRSPEETPSLAAVHGAVYDRIGWICSVCHGWNPAQNVHCTYPHVANPPADTAESCLKASDDTVIRKDDSDPKDDVAFDDR